MNDNDKNITPHLVNVDSSADFNRDFTMDSAMDFNQDSNPNFTIPPPHFSGSNHQPKPKLALIVPFYNEEAIISDSIKTFSSTMNRLKHDNIIAKDSFIVFVDDGSSDLGYSILKHAMQTHSHITALKLSTNKGHQNALIAGLRFVVDKCDCAISIDCDLQQDITKINDFIEHYKSGSHIVLGVRNNRDSDTIFKKYSAIIFYKIINLLGVKTIKNHADFRLLSNKALTFLAQYNEVNLFLRGIILELGLKTTIVYFDVQKRPAGESKYSLTKMLSLALNGITSFSITPLRIVFSIGLIISIFSAILGLYGIIVAIFSDDAVPGWASVVVPIYFLGGIQILSLGIIGEYIGKIYKETKHRPRYFIEEIIQC